MLRFFLDWELSVRSGQEGRGHRCPPLPALRDVDLKPPGLSARVFVLPGHSDRLERCPGRQDGELLAVVQSWGW